MVMHVDARAAVRPLCSSIPTSPPYRLNKVHDNEKGRGGLDVQLGSSPMTAFSVVLESISIKHRHCTSYAPGFLCPFLGGTIGESAWVHAFSV